MALLGCVVLFVSSWFALLSIVRRNNANHVLPGNDIPTILKAVLQLLPLDETAPPCILMGMVRYPVIH
jgi:L-fucose mutarotase/ribose pyranase (RbsD/FucU family)